MRLEQWRVGRAPFDRWSVQSAVPSTANPERNGHSDASYVAALKGTRTQLLDTRKTIPLWRDAQKYAVRCGGGNNHRMRLDDAIMLKENHWRYGGERIALMHKAQATEVPIIVEVTDLEELTWALSQPIDRILLDNFTLSMLKEAVAITQGRCPLEASGNVTLERIRAMAETGVDYISIGALTKHVQAIDFSLTLFDADFASFGASFSGLDGLDWVCFGVPIAFDQLDLAGLVCRCGLVDSSDCQLIATVLALLAQALMGDWFGQR